MLGALALTAAGITLGPLPVGLLDAAHAVARSVSSWWPGDTSGRPTRTETEAMLNVIVPALLIVAVAAAWPRVRPRRLLMGAVSASVFVEVVQLVLPGRHPQVRDIVLNVAGAIVGAITVVVARRLFRVSA